MNCDVCDKSFTGPVCYEQHLASEKHKKKMRQSSQNSEIFNSASESRRFVDVDHGVLHCDVCQITHYDTNRFQAHALSIGHANRVKKYHRDNELDAVSGITKNQNSPSQSEIASSKETPILKNFVDSYMHCQPCNKYFTGPEPYRQHKVSSAHIKNALKPDVQESSNGLLAALKCEICDKQFSGTVPYDDHLKSLGHKKKMQSKNLQLQLKCNESPLSCRSITSDSVTKNTAHSTIQENNSKLLAEFSGPVPYDEHLNSRVHKEMVETQKVLLRSYNLLKGKVPPPDCNITLNSEEHKKKIQRENLLSQLKYNESPQNCDITSTTDSVPKQTMQNIFQNPPIVNVSARWFCDTCRVECNGPATYSSHINGASHKKNVEKIRAGLSVQRQPPFNCGKESDTIFPPNALEKSFEPLSLENIKLKWFLPNQKLNFDIVNKNNLEEIIVDPSEIHEKCQGFDDDYEMESSFCEICDETFQSDEELQNHFESAEHLMKQITG